MPHVNVEADHEYAFTPSVEYFFNDNISCRIVFGYANQPRCAVNGNAAVKIKHLPPTINC